MASLARQYDVKRTTISKLLRDSGVTIRVSKQMNSTEIDAASKLYEAGLSLQAVGERLGWDHQTIYRHLKKRGTRFRSPNDWQR